MSGQKSRVECAKDIDRTIGTERIIDVEGTLSTEVPKM